ncbi:hypothetical protein WN55_08918 [Dufourea novaeangliae]|uniref:Uncharacterized protein n=1 Tax=Dufourea novaeangliae TaxID=178035 RepID=A0A154P6R4_DUFNO|nr:hypothetical protein WN55_08918 [Dufourea novaeangliae]
MEAFPPGRELDEHEERLQDKRGDISAAMLLRYLMPASENMSVVGDIDQTGLCSLTGMLLVHVRVTCVIKILMLGIWTPAQQSVLASNSDLLGSSSVKNDSSENVDALKKDDLQSIKNKPHPSIG